MRIRSVLLSVALALSPATLPAAASPWLEVGDNQLRSDVELLEASGVLSTVTIHWPLPWSSIAAQLRTADLSTQSAAVRTAAARLLSRANHTASTLSAYADVTNKTNVVRGFDGMGRGDGQAQVSLEGASGAFAARLSIGAITQDFGGKPNKLLLDGTYVSAAAAGVRVYAGYLDHWWGPGQISALQLSNNARPMPQVGIERSSTQASSWPILNLLGSWQAEFFLGYLDGPRLEPDTYFSGARLSINPLPGLEIAMARTEEFCGQGHPCSPLADYFHFSNNPLSANNTSDQLAFDFKYSGQAGRVPFQLYMQLMNEDYSWFNHSGTSHLMGVSAFLPMGDNPLKLMLEYSNSIATLHPFSFGDNLYGFSYINGTFLDGMRYRGRTLGFSLDDDSTLLSLQGSWSDAAGRFYELTLHHVTIGNTHTPGGYNIVSATPVLLNLAEARVRLPLSMGGQDVSLDLAGRLQDDQPRPSSGFSAGVEAAIRIRL